MKNENPEYQLMDAIDLVAYIICSKCRKEDDSVCEDLYEAMAGYYKEGWRVTESHNYCPSCAKKYLKPKNKKK